MTHDPADIVGNCDICNHLIHCDEEWAKDEEWSDVFYHAECQDDAAKTELYEAEKRACQAEDRYKAEREERAVAYYNRDHGGD